MLQAKHYLILEQFLGDYHREVHGRGIVQNVGLSPKNIALTLDELEKEGVLKSRRQGTLKLFRLNMQNREVKDSLAIAELNRKLIFLQRHRKMTIIFSNDQRIVGVFGSYANNAQRKGSDLDVFVIGAGKKESFAKAGKDLDVNVSTKFFTEHEFYKLIQEGNPLAKEIIRNHIIIFNAEKFVRLVWGAAHGHD